MIVKVRVLGYLKEYCRGFGWNERALTLPERSTAKELLRIIGIPEKESLILFVNHSIRLESGVRLREDDTVWIYPLMCDG
jgi:sulfur carrier protein ThiS